MLIIKRDIQDLNWLIFFLLLFRDLTAFFSFCFCLSLLLFTEHHQFSFPSCRSIISSPPFSATLGFTITTIDIFSSDFCNHHHLHHFSGCCPLCLTTSSSPSSLLFVSQPASSATISSLHDQQLHLFWFTDNITISSAHAVVAAWVSCHRCVAAWGAVAASISPTNAEKPPFFSKLYFGGRQLLNMWLFIKLILVLVVNIRLVLVY